MRTRSRRNKHAGMVIASVPLFAFSSYSARSESVVTESGKSYFPSAFVNVHPMGMLMGTFEGERNLLYSGLRKHQEVLKMRKNIEITDRDLQGHFHDTLKPSITTRRIVKFNRTISQPKRESIPDLRKKKRNIWDKNFFKRNAHKYDDENFENN